MSGDLVCSQAELIVWLAGHPGRHSDASDRAWWACSCGWRCGRDGASAVQWKEHYDAALLGDLLKVLPGGHGVAEGGVAHELSAAEVIASLQEALDERNAQEDGRLLTMGVERRGEVYRAWTASGWPEIEVEAARAEEALGAFARQAGALLEPLAVDDRPAVWSPPWEQG